MTTTPNAIIVEQRTVERQYGFTGHEVIVDHPVHGRLLITDGFGGIDDIRGGAVRYEHGLACKLLPGDTFESLDRGINDHFTQLDFVLNSRDSRRPVLNWDGFMLDKLAQSLGLLQ